MTGSLKNLTAQDVERLGLLSHVGKRINAPDSFHDVLQAILDSVVDSLEAERGALFITDLAGTPELMLAVDRRTDHVVSFAYSKTVVDRVWKERQPLALVDAQDDEAFASVASIQAQGIRSVICVPMVGRQSVLGMIYLDNRISNAFTGPDLQMLDIISNLAATALERTRFFEALQRLNDSLEVTVRRRTQEAEEARAQAERATKAKSLFLANMSHELRTPLNGVLGLTEDLLQGETAPSLRLRLEQIHFSAASLSTLVNGILDFSKIESGRIEHDPHTFKFEELLQATLATVAYSAQEKGLELVVEVEDAVASVVKGDSMRLKQILINLLANAVKFTSDGWVKLSVVAMGQERVRFFVSDSGIGIPEAKQALIFEPFSQADTSTTRQYGGTGLGLSICRSLTQLLGGELQLESKLGQGSCFAFDIPLEPLASYQAPDLTGLKVWVHDDQPLHLQVLTQTLTRWGAQVCRDAGGCDLGITSTGGREDLPCLRLLSTYVSADDAVDSGFEVGLLLRPVLREALTRGVEGLLTSEPESPIIVSGEDEPLLPKPPLGSLLLVAEDHEINRLVLERMLESWGYQCCFAESGLEVVQLFAEQKPRLILMDIEMPEVDGYAATRRIRALESEMGTEDGHFTPILAVTAHMAGDLRVRCMEAGLDDLLAKPISRSLLASRLILWEKVLCGEVVFSQARFAGHRELAGWPSCFLSELHASLSTLVAAVRRVDPVVIDTTVERLIRLSLASGLTQWGAQLMRWIATKDRDDLIKMVARLEQEWKSIAPTLVSASR